MSFPRRDFQICSPQEFVDTLREIKHALADGSLRQLKPADAPFVLHDLTKLAEDGPWPDYVESYFEDTGTGDRYKLTVETYHGAGGTWARL